MTHPAETARTHIMAGLEACQADPALAGALEQLAANLAKAQGKLFPAMKLPADSPGAIDMMRRAMEHLAQALKTLQDLQIESSAIGVAAASIAKALKTLHPVVQEAKERLSKVSMPPPVAAGKAAAAEAVSINVNTVLSMNTDHQFYTGFSENIDEGGIFIATFEPKPVDAPVIVNFKLPGGRPVTARGVVQWVREYNPTAPETAPGMGVKFTDLMPSDKAAIEEFAQKRAPLFYDE
ncbi:MAG: TIGR02266 family protein [Proteobacteria bacterium]|nr:TIGR02266 family protein [Pseudomonadota bacterium]